MYHLQDSPYVELRAVDLDSRQQDSTAFYETSFEVLARSTAEAEQSSRTSDPLKQAGESSIRDHCSIDIASLSRDWYHELRQVLDRPALSRLALRERQVSLSLLSRQFADVCAPIAQIIVQELPLPPQQRSIAPADIGGTAGGTKFKVGNVLFKFAVDNPEDPLYGNNPAQAGKAAKAEQRGLQAVLSSGLAHLGFPLQCLIDFGDVRLTAMCMLPICSTTLMYGSNDRGETVHDDDEHVRQLMRKLAGKLNLAQHSVSGTQLHLAGDVEGHLGTDQHAFILDTARMWPPEAPPATIACVLFCPGAEPRDVSLSSDRAILEAAHCLGAALGMDAVADDKHQQGVDIISGEQAGLFALRLSPAFLGSLSSEQQPTRCAQSNPYASMCLGTKHRELTGPFLLFSLPPDGSHLTQLLRPEAVRASPTPLSADAFTGWGAQNAQEHNKHVQDATDTVLNCFLPELAAHLVSEASGALLRPPPNALDSALPAAGGPIKHGKACEHNRIFQPLEARVRGESFNPGTAEESLEDTRLLQRLAQSRDEQRVHGNSSADKNPLWTMESGSPTGVLFRALAAPGLPYSGELDWKRHLHSFGCNTRHLGRLMHCVRRIIQAQASYIAQLPQACQDALGSLESSMLAYAVARTCKVHVWEQYRAEAGHASALSRRGFVQRYMDEWLPLQVDIDVPCALDARLPAALAAKFPLSMTAEQWQQMQTNGLWKGSLLQWRLHVLGYFARFVGADVEFKCTEVNGASRLAVNTIALRPRVSLLLGMAAQEEASTAFGDADTWQANTEGLRLQVAELTHDLIRRRSQPTAAPGPSAKTQFQLAYLLMTFPAATAAGSIDVLRAMKSQALEKLEKHSAQQFLRSVQQHTVKHKLHMVFRQCSALQQHITGASDALSVDLLSPSGHAREDDFNAAAKAYTAGCFAVQDWSEASASWVVAEIHQGFGKHAALPCTLAALTSVVGTLQEAAQRLASACRAHMEKAVASVLTKAGTNVFSVFEHLAVACWVLSRLTSKTVLHTSFHSLKATVALARDQAARGLVQTASHSMSSAIRLHSIIVETLEGLQHARDEFRDRLRHVNAVAGGLTTNSAGAHNTTPPTDYEDALRTQSVWRNLVGMAEDDGLSALCFENDNLQKARWTAFEILRGTVDEPTCLILDGYPKHGGRGAVGEGSEAREDTLGALPSVRSVEMMLAKADIEMALGRPINSNMCAQQAIKRLANVQSLSSSDSMPAMQAAQLSLAMSKAILAQYVPPALALTDAACLLLQQHTSSQQPHSVQWGGTAASSVHAMLCASLSGGAASGLQHACSHMSLLCSGIHPHLPGHPHRLGQLKGTSAPGGYFSSAGAALGMSRAQHAVLRGLGALGTGHPANIEMMEHAAEAALKTGRWSICFELACCTLDVRLTGGLAAGTQTHRTAALLPCMSSPWACIAICAFQQDIHELGMYCGLLALSAAAGGDVVGASKRLLQQLFCSESEQWALPKMRSALLPASSALDIINRFKQRLSASVEGAALSQLHLAHMVRCMDLLMCHAPIEGSWSSQRKDGPIATLLDSQTTEDMPLLHAIVHAGLSLVSKRLGIEQTAPTEAVDHVQAWVVEQGTGQGATEGAGDPILLEGDDWDAVGMTWLAWFFFRCGWYGAAQEVSRCCHRRLLQTLPIGRSGESPESALVQAAIAQGCITLQSAASECEPLCEQLLFLGIPRLACARALLCTCSIKEHPFHQRRLQTLQTELATCSIRIESSAQVVLEEFSLEAATEWLLDPDAQPGMLHAAQERNLAVWRGVLQGAFPLANPLQTASDLQTLRQDVASAAAMSAEDSASMGQFAKAGADMPSELVCIPSGEQVSLPHLSARDAIQEVLGSLYPTQSNCLEFTALTKFWQGGDDPLDYIAVYKHPGDVQACIPPHWHYISYGLTDLHGDRRSHERHTARPGQSGFGMEFTMRLAREPGDNDGPPMFPAKIMNTLARYMHASGTLVRVNEYVQHGTQGEVDREEASRMDVVQALQSQSSNEAIRSGDLMYASKPHCIGVQDPHLPSVQCATGNISFVQIVPVTDSELQAGRMWNMHGLRALLQLPPGGSRVAGEAAGWEQCRDSCGAFCPGPLLVSDTRRHVSSLDVLPEARSMLARGVQEDGSAAAEVSACLCWVPQLADLPPAQACALSEPGTCLSGVTLFCSAESLGQLALALVGRLPHARPFKVNTLHTVVQQARDSTLAARQAKQYLGGWGCTRQYFSLTTDGAGCAPIPQVAHAGAPFVVADDGHAQVYLSAHQAGVILASLNAVGLRELHAPLPMQLVWPSTVPGLELWVYALEEHVWPGVLQWVMNKNDA